MTFVSALTVRAERTPPVPARVLVPPRAGRPAAPVPPPLRDEEEQFLAWLLQRGGLDAAAYRRQPLGRRLRACLRSLHVGSIAVARERLEREPALLGTALAAVVIGVTEFFRDPPVWEHLRAQVLPRLLAERGGVRAWSAGCSEGAELYTLAMVLAEAGALEESELLGTDCRADAIARARAGSWDPAALAAAPATAAARCFTVADGRAQVQPEVRRRLRWKLHDVLQPPPALNLDLVHRD